MDAKQPPYKVGELAALAGISVRALHHYEAIGLLVPAARTPSGHRLYVRADVERLARITALTQLGLSLERVRVALDDATSTPLRLLEEHLRRARDLLVQQRDLVARLEQLREALRVHGDDVDTLLQTMKAITMIEKYDTPEQLAQLQERREALGAEAMLAVQREWQQLFAALATERSRGAAVDAPAVQALARRSRELVAMFTGGDAGITAALSRLYAEQPVDRIHPDLDPDLFGYLRRAAAALPPEPTVPQS